MALEFDIQPLEDSKKSAEEAIKTLGVDKQEAYTKLFGLVQDWIDNARDDMGKSKVSLWHYVDDQVMEIRVRADLWPLITGG